MSGRVVFLPGAPRRTDFDALAFRLMAEADRERAQHGESARFEELCVHLGACIEHAAATANAEAAVEAANAAVVPR